MLLGAYRRRDGTEWSQDRDRRCRVCVRLGRRRRATPLRALCGPPGDLRCTAARQAGPRRQHGRTLVAQADVALFARAAKASGFLGDGRRHPEFVQALADEQTRADEALATGVVLEDEEPRQPTRWQRLIGAAHEEVPSRVTPWSRLAGEAPTEVPKTRVPRCDRCRGDLLWIIGRVPGQRESLQFPWCDRCRPDRRSARARADGHPGRGAAGARTRALPLRPSVEAPVADQRRWPVHRLQELRASWAAGGGLPAPDGPARRHRAPSCWTLG
jgi:hypothetical protein